MLVLCTTFHNINENSKVRGNTCVVTGIQYLFFFYVVTVTIWNVTFRVRDNLLIFINYVRKPILRNSRHTGKIRERNTTTLCEVSALRVCCVFPITDVCALHIHPYNENRRKATYVRVYL